MAPRKKAKLETRAMYQGISSTESKPRPRMPSKEDITHCRLLDLTAELRHTVYDKIIEETYLILPRSNANRPLGLSSAFTRVSKVIRSEFLPLALKATPVIRTEVRNWDFGHIVGFMNRIGEDEMEKLIQEQRVVVDMWFTGENADPSGLMRWLDRFDNEKRGDGVTFDYTCTNTKSSRQNWGIASFRACTSGGPKGSIQFEKIAGVFGAWN